ncbi:hypothetical protein CGLO_14303 [Colletotrichum gloeosporioides Cg-14]|uniref:Uncharacterized protein n=1 Tax=Colletotrichum gloeosporioides (strain Cg-14) TaxID=1237896 RepID=T0JUK3_COLGC|nr:hypothetical protein CGLO_14303 [Colletotrichum gloeosporioides Cg-14]
MKGGSPLATIKDVAKAAQVYENPRDASDAGVELLSQ